ncbi:aminodeoxychorismate lyase, partial [Pseudomonas syringae pv. tagetis]
WPVCGCAASIWPVGPLTRIVHGIARCLLDI